MQKKKFLQQGAKSGVGNCCGCQAANLPPPTDLRVLKEISGDCILIAWQPPASGQYSGFEVTHFFRTGEI